MRKAARRAIYRAMAADPSPRPAFEDWTRARDAGIDIAPSPAVLRPWRPALANVDDWRDPPKLAPAGADALVMDCDLDPPEAQALWRAADRNGIAPRLFEADRRLEGYAWYDAIDRVTGIVTELVLDGKSSAIDDAPLPERTGPTAAELPPRPEAVRIALAIRAADGPAPALGLPTDLAFAGEAWSWLDDALPLVTADSALQPHELAALLRDGFFSPSDDADADSYETQLARFDEDALHLATRLLLSDDEACRTSIAEVGWVWKDAYEAAEAAVVIFMQRYGRGMRRNAGDGGPRRMLAMLEALAALEPSHTRRSEEQVRLQQFSTPLPLAYAALQAAAIRPGDVVLEPSAGTGMLAVMAQCALGNSTAGNLHLNEYAQTRARLLTRLFSGRRSPTVTAAGNGGLCGAGVSETVEEGARAPSDERRPTTGGRGSRGSGRCGRSEAEFAVRAETHQIEMFGVGLAVDQDQVGPDVTVPVVLPLPTERVVAMARRERPVLGEPGHDIRKLGIDGPGEAALLLAPVIPLEGRGPSNRPH